MPWVVVPRMQVMRGFLMNTNMEVTSASNRVSTSAYASRKSVLSARTVSR